MAQSRRFTHKRSKFEAGKRAPALIQSLGRASVPAFVRKFPRTESMIAESIAHYRIIRKLGAGGMGEVYLALDTKLDRKVAIKVLLPDSLAEENLKKRLLREARAVAREFSSGRWR